MHDHPEADAADKLDWAVARSRALGLRRTKALDALLGVLIEAKHPLSLADLADSDAPA